MVNRTLKDKIKREAKKCFILSEIIFTLKSRKFERPQSVLHWIWQTILSCEMSKPHGGVAKANLVFWYISQCLKYQTNYTCLEDSLLFLANRTLQILLISNPLSLSLSSYTTLYPNQKSFVTQTLNKFSCFRNGLREGSSSQLSVRSQSPRRSCTEEMSCTYSERNPHKYFF